MFFVLHLLLAATAVAAQEPDKSAWKDFQPEFPAAARKQVTEAYPFSDPQNAGKWERYAPMSDEFVGSRLDPEKWWDQNPEWKGRQPAFFAPTNVAIRDGKLHLTMRKEHPPANLKGEGYHIWSSAAVQSKGTILYGYFEVKAKPMRSHGSSAFWFYRNTEERWTEIDVFEIGGGAPKFERKLHMTVHVFHTPTEKKHWQIEGIWNAPFDLADDWHVYGLEWDEKEIKFYFDGVLVRQGPNSHWHQPLTMNFDSETMPDWFGLPQDKDLPSTFQIEYVHAWKHQKDR